MTVNRSCEARGEGRGTSVTMAIAALGDDNEGNSRLEAATTSTQRLLCEGKGREVREGKGWMEGEGPGAKSRG